MRMQEKITTNVNEKDIEKRNELEKQIPGGAELLNKTYGIQKFRRYPLEVLLSQIQQEQEQLPYGLIVLTRGDDEAAFNNLEVPLKNLYERTKGRYAMRIVEVDSKIDLAKKLITLNKKYGDKNKIGYLMIAGHGINSGSGLELGHYDSKIPREINHENKNVLWMDESGSASFKKVNQEYLDPDAEILFLSCSTGKRKALAEEVSVSLQRKTAAPSIAVLLHNLSFKVSYDEKHKIHFKPIFQNEEVLTMEYDNRDKSKMKIEEKEEVLDDLF